MATQPILEKPAPDYRDESRFERIDGHYVERPAPGESHAEVQTNLVLLLREWAKKSNGKALTEWSVTQPEMADSNDPNYMTPDVLLAKHPYATTKRGHLIPPGFLAIEVKSPDQENLDLIDKAERYVAWGIPHVWIIDPETKRCLEYHGGNQITIVRDVLRADDLNVPIDSIFEAVS